MAPQAQTQFFADLTDLYRQLGGGWRLEKGGSGYLQRGPLNPGDSTAPICFNLIDPERLSRMQTGQGLRRS